RSLGAAVGADAAGPGEFLDEGLGDQDFAGEAVEDVEEAVAIALQEELAGLAAEVGVDKDGRFGGIPIVEVVRGELVIPLELAGGGVERDDGGGVEVVAFAFVAVVVGAGV